MRISADAALVGAHGALTRSEIFAAGGPYDSIATKAAIRIPTRPYTWISEAVLDPGIRNLVRRLCSAGFATTASCEGGEGHAFPFPTVQIGPARYGYTMQATAEQLSAWCADSGLDGYTVSTHRMYQRQRPMKESYIQLEVWGRAEAGLEV
jgi:hypothetical protein